MTDEELRAAVRDRALVEVYGIIARAAAWHEPGTYTSPHDGVIVPAAVVELDDGNALVAKPEEFHSLTEDEAAYHATLVGVLRAALQGAVKLGAAKKLAPQRIVAILAAVLRGQQAALGAQQ